MSKKENICLIGDIVVDVTLKSSNSDIKVRLGGLVHAARALWSLGVPYDIAYFAPAYLDVQIRDYLIHHGCSDVIKLGNVLNAPYVFLINDAKESGDQGYEFILRENITVEYDGDNIQSLVLNKYKDYFLISGNYDLSLVINKLPNKIHIDFANNIQNDFELKNLRRKIDTIFLSTSSPIFGNKFNGDFLSFASQFEEFAIEFVLKENRGGSRGYNYFLKKEFHAPAQPRKIIHSIGVGDVFDVTYISQFNDIEQLKKITLASWVAAEYAVTTFPDDFKQGVTRVLKSPIDDLVKMEGNFLPWEERKKINIYVAAPDFDFVNTDLINRLSSALLYHNFSPRRPIKENGQMEKNADKARRQELVEKDLQLLEECKIIVVVLLYDDPGTFIELGYAKAKEMPIIVYDPFKSANNCMLTELPILVSDDLDEIITEIFTIGSKILSHGK